MSGYDQWKTTDRADEQLGRTDGRPTRYRCRDCAWSGNGSLARAAHWRATGHTVLPASDPRFSEPAKRESA